MKKIFFALILTFFFTNNSFAETLLQALNQAFNNNAELNAERENLTISEQDLKITKSEYLPSASITSSKSQEDTNKLTNQSGGDATINDVDSLTTSIKIEQTLIDFGRDADYKKKKIGINLAREKLLRKEQEIIFKAIEAYSGLVLAIEKEDINKQNLNLKRSQLQTDRIRLERGQIKVSDFAQSESSFAGAEAQYIQVQNEVVTSRLNYENVIGNISDENSLQKLTQSIVNIPLSLENAIELSKHNNHDVIIAKLELEQAEKDITIAKSDLAPTASLSLERSYTEDLSTTYDEREKDILKATVNWPFFSGGKKFATVDKNQSIKVRQRLLLDNAVKNNLTAVTSAWVNLKSSESFLNSVKTQVKAAEIANEGIAAEYQSGVGSRSTLDVIQSNALLLDAQISLANSERNYLLAQYSLLKSVGLLNSSYLNLR
jgi:outer membrane protein|tara:strand:- start:588 stop:1886 length:1299 start_codon:yes stop_codon:yes gene_type:complete